MVTFSVAALIDLDDIYDFHLGRNPAYAADLTARLRKAARSLAVHPERGAPINGAPRPLRRLVESGHAIVYELTGSGVTIARVLHGARDINAILQDLS